MRLSPVAHTLPSCFSIMLCFSPAVIARTPTCTTDGQTPLMAIMGSVNVRDEGYCQCIWLDSYGERLVTGWARKYSNAWVLIIVRWEARDKYDRKGISETIFIRFEWACAATVWLCSSLCSHQWQSWGLVVADPSLHVKPTDMSTCTSMNMYAHMYEQMHVLQSTSLLSKNRS